MATYKDRLIFDEVQLSNGMKVYFYPKDLPFADVRIVVPWGSIHNVATIRPGSFHFLEHLCMNHSELYPKQGEFKRLIGLKGGNLNAVTSNRCTEYWLDVPSEMFELGFVGLMNQVFRPIISDIDITAEVSVISNERRRKSKWWPGTDPFEYYVQTKWRDGPRIPFRQIMGDEEDLEAFTVAECQALHKHYFDQDTFIMVGGNFDRECVLREAEKLSLAKHTLPNEIKPWGWNDRQYREVAFEETQRFMYHLGGTGTVPDPRFRYVLSFLSRFMVNTVHGPLYQWLREEKGWIYNLDFEFTVDKESFYWELWIPLQKYGQVEETRRELLGKMRSALLDEALVQTEIERRFAADLFGYQLMEKILDSATSDLVSKGKIVGENEARDHMSSLQDNQYLLSAFDAIMDPAATGELLAVPK